MSFDLGDCTKWEFMFPQTEQPQLLVPEQEGIDDNADEDVSPQVVTSLVQSTARKYFAQKFPLDL